MAVASFLRRSSRRYDEPHLPLVLFTFTAMLFLFLAAFSAPYISSIYLAKAMRHYDMEIVTFGTLGFCCELGGMQACPTTVPGYQIDINIQNACPIPAIPISVTKALLLHIVAFVLTLVSAGIIVCAHFVETYLAKWTAAINSLVALFIMGSFIADLTLVASVRTAFDPEDVVEIGNGTWFTLAAFLLIFTGICSSVLRPSQVASILQRKPRQDMTSHPFKDLEARSASHFSGDHTLVSQSSVTITTNNHTAQITTESASTNLYDSSNETHQNSKASRQSDDLNEKDVYIGEVSSTPDHPVPILIRDHKLPGIVINGYPRSPTASLNTPIRPFLPLSPLRRPPSQYAPSTYSTYRSQRSSAQTAQTDADCVRDAIFFTPTALSRASTMCSATIPENLAVDSQTSSQRSTPEYERIYSWRNNKNFPKKTRLSGFQQPYLSHLMGSASTLASSVGSVIRGFPGVPSTQAIVSTQLPMSSHRFGGDRFIEGVMAADEKSLASAIESSDLEMSIRTDTPPLRTRFPFNRPAVDITFLGLGFNSKINV